MAESVTIWLVYSKNSGEGFEWEVESAFETADQADDYIKKERQHGSGLWKYRKEPCSLIKS